MLVMAGQVWVSLISLGGIVLGGVLSYLVQYRTQQSAERAEQERQWLSLSETRRAERLALLERFIEVSAEAERCAYTRPSEWEDTDTGTSRPGTSCTGCGSRAGSSASSSP